MVPHSEVVAVALLVHQVREKQEALLGVPAEAAAVGQTVDLVQQVVLVALVQVALVVMVLVAQVAALELHHQLRLLLEQTAVVVAEVLPQQTKLELVVVRL